MNETTEMVQTAGAAGGGQAAGGGASAMGMMLPFILMIAIIYFLIIRPQSKRQKEHQKMLGGLVKGDRILTSGGLYGVVKDIKEDVLIVKIAEGTHIELARAHVSAVIRKKEQ